MIEYYFQKNAVYEIRKEIFCKLKIILMYHYKGNSKVPEAEIHRMPLLLLEITTRLLVSVYNISLGYRDSFLSRLMLLMQLLRV